MKNLFKSQTAYAILELLTADLDKAYSLSELTARIKKDPANISRELAHLIKEKIILVENKAKKKFYYFNKSYQSAPELISLFQKNQTSELDKKFKHDWMLAEEIINANPWFMAIPFYCFTNQFSSPGGAVYQDLVCVYRDYHLWFYFDRQDANRVGEHLVDKFVAHVSFMEKVNTQIRFFADKLVKLVSQIPETNLNKLSNKSLWKFYKDHEDLHWEYYQWGWIPVAADMFGDNLTKRGKKILKDLGVPAGKIEAYLNLLTQPVAASLLKEEQDHFLQIAIKVQADQRQFTIFKDLFRKFKEEDVKFFGLYTHSEEYEAKFEEVVRSLKKLISKNILDDLQKHYTKYFYTKFIYTEEQGTYSFEYYLKELVRLVNSNPNLKATAFKQKQSDLKVQADRRGLVKKLKLKPELNRFFSAWGDFMVTKIYRRYAQLLALYKTTYILEEIASRIGVTLKEIRFMTSSEIAAALFKGEIDQEKVKSRIKLSVYYTAKNTEVFYSGELAKKIVETYIQKNNYSDLSELTGQCGCRGQARGIVKIVDVTGDMAKLKPGEILVSISTQPDLLPAMRKAAAFITDQGGVTSHAAIVAREMNTPCVIGTKIATQVLHDGDLVDLDADKGIVRIIKRGSAN